MEESGEKAKSPPCRCKYIVERKVTVLKVKNWLQNVSRRVHTNPELVRFRVTSSSSCSPPPPPPTSPSPLSSHRPSTPVGHPNAAKASARYNFQTFTWIPRILPFCSRLLTVRYYAGTVIRDGDRPAGRKFSSSDVKR